MSTQQIAAREAPPHAPCTTRPVDRTLLLLLATAGLTEEWSLLSAASLVLQRAVGEADVEPLIRAGLVVRRRTCVALCDDDVVTATLDSEAPSAVASAHAAWARVLIKDPLNRVWHEAMAHQVPNQAAARQARLAALRFQAASRHEDAVGLFERAAWLSEEPGESVHMLAQGAACAYAAGLWGRATELLVTARRIEPPEDTARVLDVLEAAFRGSGPGAWSWQHQVEAAHVLHDWGQTAAGFAVLAASPPDAWCADRGTWSGTGSDMAMTGLATLRAGSVSLSLPALECAAHQFENRGERGAAAVAHALVGEAATCLGQVPTATEALARAGQLSRETGQHRWQVLVELANSLLGAWQGRDEPAATQALHEAALSGSPARRDRAELVQAVALLAHERWLEGYDVLAALVAQQRSSIPDLVAWGLLSHLADAALHADRVQETRALISGLGAAEGVFENDVALAELMYATAILSDADHADACFEALLSYDLGRWPWLGARAHLARGEQLRRSRRVVEARRHLTTAQRTFAALGSRLWAQRAALELRAAGVRDESASACSVPLAPQELEIARMAARGLTNREIGAVLSLSPRTVGAHLYRLFPKLGITKRIQLTSVLAGTETGAGS
jgi:DNA-binding CsgD family transcriptional regulator